MPRSKTPLPTPPYAPLTPAPPLERLMRLGWRIGANPTIALAVPIDWAQAATADRSWAFHLLALDMIDPLLVDHAATGDVDSLILATDIVLDWLGAFDADQSDELQWYDMAVGLRAWRLSYILQALKAAGLGNRAGLKEIRACVEEHERRLLPDADFTANSNHGFFQAAGLMAIADSGLALDATSKAVASARMQMVLDTHFSPEGVHREHSPDYHYFMHLGLSALAKRELDAPPELGQRIRLIGEALSWFVKPNDRLANFGDSDNRLMSAEMLAELPPRTTGLKTFPQGGYAVLRRPGGYLAQTLCYHSRVHKQVDDLSLVWQAGGVDVLVDAGRLRYGEKQPPDSDLRRRGYRYADPSRVYCESVEAHNTLQIDGAEDSRQGRPYGSALLAAAQVAGVVAVLSRAPRRPVTHRRLILGDGETWLLVVDGVEGGLLPRRARQFFHLGPDWRPVATDEGFRIEGETRSLTVRSLSGRRFEGPWSGETDPELKGWWSPGANRLEPAASIASVGRTHRPIATSLSFDDAPAPEGVVDMNARLEGAISLQIGADRTVSVTVDDQKMSLRVQERAA